MLVAHFLSAGPVAARNPLFTAADPHAFGIGGEIWIYPTGGGSPTEFYAWSSGDLNAWKKSGPVFRLEDARWIPDDGAPRHFAWAPCVVRERDRVYFYYSAGPQNPTPSRIGVAVGDGPQGPFKDSGKPLLTGSDDFEAIDPFVFKDPSSGRNLLYAGGSAGARLRLFELGADMISIQREIPVKTPLNFTEGAFVHFHRGLYYLSYSHGSYREDTYSVHYSSSPSPFGPWTYGGSILCSDSRHKGPGHHSIIEDPKGNGWWIIYHRWNRRNGPGPYEGQRVTCIDRLIHSPEGRMLPVIMTDEGVENPSRER